MIPENIPDNPPRLLTKEERERVLKYLNTDKELRRAVVYLWLLYKPEEGQQLLGMAQRAGF